MFLRPLSAAAQGSAYLLTHRSWTSRIGTGLRKWSFSRPRRLVTTRPASSSCFRCFMTPKRDISKRPSSALSVCPSSRKSSSSKLRRVGSARALNTSSTPESICDLLVTCQRVVIEAAEVIPPAPRIADAMAAAPKPSSAARYAQYAASVRGWSTRRDPMRAAAAPSHVTPTAACAAGFRLSNAHVPERGVRAPQTSSGLCNRSTRRSGQVERGRHLRRREHSSKTRQHQRGTAQTSDVHPRILASEGTGVRAGLLVGGGACLVGAAFGFWVRTSPDVSTSWKRDSAAPLIPRSILRCMAKSPNSMRGACRRAR